MNIHNFKLTEFIEIVTWIQFEDWVIEGPATRFGVLVPEYPFLVQIYGTTTKLLIKKKDIPHVAANEEWRVAISTRPNWMLTLTLLSPV